MATVCSNIARHVVVVVDDGVQREMPGGVLHDQEGRVVVGDVVVAALADRDALEQVVAVIQRLAQLQQIRPRRRSVMPSCLRTVLPPPSQPTR